MSNFPENNTTSKNINSNINTKNQSSEEDLIIKSIKELKDEEKRSKAI